MQHLWTRDTSTVGGGAHSTKAAHRGRSFQSYFVFFLLYVHIGGKDSLSTWLLCCPDVGLGKNLPALRLLPSRSPVLTTLP